MNETSDLIDPDQVELNHWVQQSFKLTGMMADCDTEAKAAVQSAISAL